MLSAGSPARQALCPGWKLFLVCPLLLGSDAVRAESLIEEYFVVETASLQSRGEVQFTSGFDYFRNGDSGQDSLTAGVEYGVTDSWQLEATHSWRRDECPAGQDQVCHRGTRALEIGLTYGLGNDDDRKFDVAFGLELGLPVEPGDARVYEPFIVIGRKLGDRSSFVLQLAAGFDDPDTSTARTTRELGLGGGVVFSVTTNWRSTFEFDYESETYAGDTEWEAFITPGVIFAGIEDAEFGLAVSIGMGDEGPDRVVRTSFNLEF